MLFSHVIDQTIKKLKANLANILTFSNLFMGGFAIIFATKGNLQFSALLIFLAALADRYDGMIARKLNVESELGKQLDSMSDIISFGVAPALLLYNGILFEYGVPGVFFTVLYIGCGAFRLARFNITESNGYYTGLPITAAGCLMTLGYILIPYLRADLYIFLVLFLSFFMVSTISIKKV